MRPVAVLLTLLLALSALAACGEDDAGPAADEASAEAQRIAEATRELERDLTRAGREAIAGAEGTAETADEELVLRLEALEERARELAERAERELAGDEQARESLRRANEDVAQASESLQDLVRQNDGEAADRARRLLEEVAP